MTYSAFDYLASHCAEKGALVLAYNEVIRGLLASPFWSGGGSVKERRVLWMDAKSARKADSETFKLSGVYVWGVEDRPLYIGMTGKIKKSGKARSFGDRIFSRYIGGTMSQCLFAKRFEVALIEKGIAGFPPEIHGLYANRSKVRLHGAVRFATEGIDRTWFALYPASDPGLIRTVEKVLIPVANAWNLQAGLKPLLNIESNRRWERPLSP